MTLSDRERFLSLLFTAPLLRADAIVLLAGEDADARAAFAAGLYHQARGSMPIYVTGGRDEPPRHIGAEAVAGKLMGLAVPPNQITVDLTALNTHGQAIWLAETAIAKDWRRVLLVASAFHLPRAVLTVVQALDERNLGDRVHVVPCAAERVEPWLDCLDADVAKCDEYAAHVSRPARGVAYLQAWRAR